MKINKKIVIISSCVCVGALVFIIAVSAFKTKVTWVLPEEEKVYSVQVMNIRKSNNDVFLNYAGMVQPSKTEQVNFATIGEIKKIYFKEGDNIKKGDILVTLDDDDARQRQESSLQAMRAAEASRNSSKTTLDAATRAYDTGGKKATQAELDSAKKTLDTATAQRDTEKQDLDRINTICQPKRDAVTTAQQNADATQGTYNAAQANLATAQGEAAALQAEIDKLTVGDSQIAILETKKKAIEDNINNTLTPAVTAAQTALDAANTDLRTAQLALIKEETDLQKIQKETQLQTSETQIVAAQAEYDRLKNQGTGNNEALQSQLDTATYAHESAKASYDSAKSNYESATAAVEKCVYKAKEDGFVVKVIGTQGGMATPLAPVLVVGSFDLVAQFGVSQTDIREITPNLSAQIIINGETFDGTVKDVAVTPDETTRTYITNVAIANTPRDLYLGELATVNISLGERNGVWLPLSVILNDGQDYIYIIENDRATRKDIKIVDINNDLVRVTGLEDGGRVISMGMKTVKSGNLVTVVE